MQKLYGFLDSTELIFASERTLPKEDTQWQAYSRGHLSLQKLDTCVLSESYTFGCRHVYYCIEVLITYDKIHRS